jgi:hypothetical protein
MWVRRTPDPLEWRRKFLERRYREVYLPEMHNQFEVDGVPLSPAEALEKCRPDQYQIALTEYARREGEAALENACERFPFPVAIALNRGLNSAPNEHQRLLHFRDTAELLILVLLAVVVGECRAKGIKLKGVKYPDPSSGKPLDLTAAKLLNGSVAHRLTMLDGILQALAGNPNLVCVERIPLDAVRRLGQFKVIRNEFSHYEAMAEHEAALVCQDLREQLADAMIAFEWLADTELAIFDNAVKGKRNTGRFELHCGHAQGMPRKERPLSEPALVKCQGIIAGQFDRPLFHFAGEVFEATPFLHSELHPKGHRRHIWVLKRYFPNTGEFEFEIVGEREPARVVTDSPTTVELKTLDDLFS